MTLKKGALIISVGAVTIDFFIAFIFYGNCWPGTLCRSVQEIAAGFLPLCIVFFLLSIAMYFVPEKIFGIWIRYSYIAIPISLILIFVSSPESGGYIFPSDRALAALYVPVAYAALLVVVLLVAQMVRKKAKS